MSLWGMPWSARWGLPEDHIQLVETDDLGDGFVVRFNPISLTGFDQYFRLQVGGENQGPAFYAEHVTAPPYAELSGSYVSPAADGQETFFLVGQGDWPNSIDLPYLTEIFEAGRANRFNISMTAVPNLDSYGHESQLTSWVLTGLQRFTNCMPSPLNRNWGLINVSIVATGGDRTVTLSVSNQIVASGTRTGNGSVTLAEQNDSGLSGTVTLTYTADASGAQVVARWPAKYQIHYRAGTPWTSPDFPRTPEGIVNDDGFSNTFKFISPILAAGTWYVVTVVEDENGNDSTGIYAGGDTAATVAVPAPPTDLAYSSGNATATIIQWTASATVGATYNIYDSGSTGATDLSTIATTRTSGSGTLTKALAAFPSTYTGKRRIIVRSLNGGIEDGNIEILEIEYVSGLVVTGRPPEPIPGNNITLSGRTVTVPVSINTLNKAATPDLVLFYLLDPDATEDYDEAQDIAYNNPSDVVEVGDEVSAAITTDSTGAALEVSATHTANALRKYALRTATAVGTASIIVGIPAAELHTLSLSGVTLAFTNGGILYWSLTDAAGTRTINIYSDYAKTNLVATGNRVGDGTITITASGGSGITGTVIVAYVSDNTDSGNAIQTNYQSNNITVYGPVMLTIAAPANAIQVVDEGHV